MTPCSVAVVALIVMVVGCTTDDQSSDAGSSTPSASSTDAGSTGATATSPSTTGVDQASDDVVSPPAGAGGEATGPLGSTELQVETDAGTVQIGAGSVPDRLDPQFPLPPDLDVELVSQTSTDLGFSGVSGLPFADLVELFEVGLPAAGYTIDSIDVRGSDFAVIEFSNADGLGQVAVSRLGGAGTRTVIVAFGDGEGEEAQLEN